MATSLHDGWRGARGKTSVTPHVRPSAVWRPEPVALLINIKIPVTGLTATSPDLGCYQNVKSKEQERV